MLHFPPSPPDGEVGVLEGALFVQLGVVPEPPVGTETVGIETVGTGMVGRVTWGTEMVGTEMVGIDTVGT